MRHPSGASRTRGSGCLASSRSRTYTAQASIGSDKIAPGRLEMTIELVDEFRLDAGQQEAIRGLLREAWPDAEFTASRTYLKQIPARRLLATRDGEVIGHLGLEHRVIGTSSGPASIFGVVDLCVRASCRREGVASEMLAWVESLARRHGIDFLVLFADDARLYERGGYARAANLVRWPKIHEHHTFELGEEAVEALMVKPTS